METAIPDRSDSNIKDLIVDFLDEDRAILEARRSKSAGKKEAHEDEATRIRDDPEFDRDEPSWS